MWERGKGVRAIMGGGQGVRSNREGAAAPIEVVAYDPAWPEEFEAIRAILAPALGNLALAIEHVGSTSVPDLAAKPILDIDIVISAAGKLPVVIERLAPLGYYHQGDLGVPGREAFKREGDDVPRDGSGRAWTKQHLYACPAGNIYYLRHIALRDYLRAHPADALAYAALKLRLAQEFRDDRVAYTEAKTEFITAIYRKAGVG